MFEQTMSRLGDDVVAGLGRRVGSSGYVESEIHNAVYALKLAQGGIHYRLYDREGQNLSGADKRNAQKVYQDLGAALATIQKALKGLRRVDLDFTG